MNIAEAVVVVVVAVQTKRKVDRDPQFSGVFATYGFVVGYGDLSGCILHS